MIFLFFLDEYIKTLSLKEIVHAQDLNLQAGKIHLMNEIDPLLSIQRLLLDFLLANKLNMYAISFLKYHFYL